MYDWNNWYLGWGWFLWVGVWFLLISSFGNWGYTYRAHRLYRDLSSGKTANDILNERYARGELTRDEFQKMKAEISEIKTMRMDPLSPSAPINSNVHLTPNSVPS